MTLMEKTNDHTAQKFHFVGICYKTKKGRP